MTDRKTDGYTHSQKERDKKIDGWKGEEGGSWGGDVNWGGDRLRVGEHGGAGRWSGTEAWRGVAWRRVAEGSMTGEGAPELGGCALYRLRQVCHKYDVDRGEGVEPALQRACSPSPPPAPSVPRAFTCSSASPTSSLLSLLDTRDPLIPTEGSPGEGGRGGGVGVRVGRMFQRIPICSRNEALSNPSTGSIQIAGSIDNVSLTPA